jgi:hypothetical protein
MTSVTMIIVSVSIVFSFMTMSGAVIVEWLLRSDFIYMEKIYGYVYYLGDLNKGLFVFNFYFIFL